jgi:hypothetical protein
MKIEQVGKLSALDRFFYWIHERHQIYLRRKAGQQKPWTDDEVLQKFFFTNPYRENDRVTVWFRENIREPLRNDPRVLFATVAFRWFNLPATGKFLMGIHDVGKKTRFGLLTNWDEESAIGYLAAHAGSGNKVFTGAYMVPAAPGTKKYEHACRWITNVWREKDRLLLAIFANGTLEGAHAVLAEMPWIGKFAAYEIVTDLRHTYLLENAPDIMTWANPGPGCIRGLYRLRGLPLSSRGNSDCLPRPDGWLEQMQELLALAQKRMPKMPKFEMREVEHSLCESDKYERARLGDGKLKRTYQGV